MKKSRYSEEHIVRTMQDQESGRKAIVVFCKEFGIAKAKFHKRK